MLRSQPSNQRRRTGTKCSVSEAAHDVLMAEAVGGVLSVSWTRQPCLRRSLAKRREHQLQEAVDEVDTRGDCDQQEPEPERNPLSTIHIIAEFCTKKIGAYVVR